MENMERAHGRNLVVPIPPQNDSQTAQARNVAQCGAIHVALWAFENAWKIRFGFSAERIRPRFSDHVESFFDEVRIKRGIPNAGFCNEENSVLFIAQFLQLFRSACFTLPQSLNYVRDAPNEWAARFSTDTKPFRDFRRGIVEANRSFLLAITGNWSGL